MKDQVEIFGIRATEEPPPDWTGAQYQTVRASILKKAAKNKSKADPF